MKTYNQEGRNTVIAALASGPKTFSELRKFTEMDRHVLDRVLRCGMDHEVFFRTGKLGSFVYSLTRPKKIYLNSVWALGATV